MSNLQIIEELCRICEVQSNIIKEQAYVLEEYGEVIMAEERARVNTDLNALISHDEDPDEAEEE
ncbi:MAG: hypothetical protein NC452_02290 [Eubacterium sp.]|nr:hypothetical protein [Eubacterium sp.]